MLDREAARRDLSRSALIRLVLEEHLRDEREAEVSRRIVEGYKRLPPATPDEWGNLAASGDRAALDVLQRLEAEERAAGCGPW